MTLRNLTLLTLALSLMPGCGGGDESDATGGSSGTAGSGGSGGSSGAGGSVEADASNDVADSGSQDQQVDDALNPDAPDDTSTEDAQPDAEPVEYTSMGTLTVDCDVPFILDASKVTNMTYMTSHFGHLVQQYGITGVIDGQDITAFPEKMYYGAHMPPDLQPSDLLSLVQISMASVSQPTYSVRVDFRPDTSVTTGATWKVGLDDGNALAALYKHVSTNQLCLMSMGYGGQLTFQSAANTTQVEGGSFHVVGTMNMVVPDEVPDLCDMAAQLNTPCCQ